MDSICMVVGLGNELLGDDGVGVHAVRAMAANPPPGAALLEIGTAVWHLADMLHGGEHLVAIDAVATGRPPGTVVLMQGSDAHAALRDAGAHGLGLMEMLALSNAQPASVTVVGVEPQRLEYTTSLSQPVAAALPHVLAAVHWLAAPNPVAGNRSCSQEILTDAIFAPHHGLLA
jgi:hydrogenase maturation protease